ncbi:MAG: hypothetical protein PHV28_07595 [Kiritimatiellae bacterium]|nr:hypothetical protein [Kiritimatiellia bacterium]
MALFRSGMESLCEGQLGTSRTAPPELFIADLKKFTDADRKAQQDLQAK